MLKNAGYKFYKNECNSYEPDVLILIDHINREMQFASILKDRLTKVGIKTEIITTKFNLHRIPILYKSNIIITPWIYTNRESELFCSIYKPNSKQNALVINLHCEQIAGEASSRFLLPKGNAIKCKHISWSTSFTRKLKKVGVSEIDILEFGNPKLDYYRKFQKNKNCKNVLIVGNAFHLLTREEEQRFRSNGINIEGIGRSGRLNYEKLVNLLPQILLDYPRLNFVYRPHPSFANRDCINPDLVTLARKYSNFRIEHKGAISEAMSQAAVMLSFHSTSYLESAMTGIPYATIRFEPIPESDNLEDLDDWPVSISNLADFKQTLDDALDNSLNPRLEERYALLRNKYYMNSDLSVAESVAELATKALEMNQSGHGVNLPLSKKLRFAALFSVKLAINYLSTRSNSIRRWLISHKDYRIQNLAYMWGDDAFDKSYFR